MCPSRPSAPPGPRLRPGPPHPSPRRPRPWCPRARTGGTADDRPGGKSREHRLTPTGPNPTGPPTGPLTPTGPPGVRRHGEDRRTNPAGGAGPGPPRSGGGVDAVSISPYHPGRTRIIGSVVAAGQDFSGPLGEPFADQTSPMDRTGDRGNDLWTTPSVEQSRGRAPRPSRPDGDPLPRVDAREPRQVADVARRDDHLIARPSHGGLRTRPG